MPTMVSGTTNENAAILSHKNVWTYNWIWPAFSPKMPTIVSETTITMPAFYHKKIYAILSDFLSDCLKQPTHKWNKLFSPFKTVCNLLYCLKKHPSYYIVAFYFLSYCLHPAYSVILDLLKKNRIVASRFVQCYCPVHFSILLPEKVQHYCPYSSVLLPKFSSTIAYKHVERMLLTGLGARNYLLILWFWIPNLSKTICGSVGRFIPHPLGWRGKTTHSGDGFVRVEDVPKPSGVDWLPRFEVQLGISDRKSVV